MGQESRDVFKFVSLRGTEKGMTLDPSDLLAKDTVLMARLAAFEFAPSSPPAQVVTFVSGFPRLEPSKLKEFLLHTIAKELNALERPIRQLAAIKKIEVGFDGETVKLNAFAATSKFQQEYESIIDSWLILFLTGRPKSERKPYENLLRAGAVSMALHGGRLGAFEVEEILNLLKATVIFPRRWRPSRYRRDAIKDGLEDRFAFLGSRPKATIEKSIEGSRLKMETEIARAQIREALQQKTRAAYADHKKSSANVQKPGAPRHRPIPLNDSYFTLLKSTLTVAENKELASVLTANRLPSAFDSLPNLNDALLPEVAWDAAADACASIQLFEKQKTQQLPEPNITGLVRELGSISSVGWGDLIVVRERLVNYEANEIAHIENIMPGERRLREKERKLISETVEEDKTESVTESTQELETTERQELRTQVKTAIASDFSVEAGVNTSGRYGLTKVDTSLTASLSRSKSEARSSATSLAKEITSRAVEYSYESVRALRRSTITEKLRELNRHEFDNTAKEGVATPVAQSGIYLWVEQVKELQLHHYGRRLMVEFHIPEPGLTLLSQRLQAAEEARIPKPAPFTIDPGSISPANYKCLARLYDVDGVDPPEPKWVSVAKGWNSTPDEGVDGNAAEDTQTLELNIPDGYIPREGAVRASLQTKNEAAPGGAVSSDIFFALSVGGVIEHIQFPEFSATEDMRKPVYIDAEIAFDKGYSWPETSVPISFRAHGHFDKTMYVQVTVYCERMAETYTRWQLRTWEQIKAGHAIMVADYQRAVRELGFSEDALFAAPKRSERQNRSIEREELAKWAIKMMRIDSFEFNAVDEVQGIPEINAQAAADQSPIVSFFENVFEWGNMSYILHPYFWGRRAAWQMRLNLSETDVRHEKFLRAGSARVIVPITAGREAQFLSYLETDAADAEFDRILSTQETSPTDTTTLPEDTEFEDLWLELLLHNREDLSWGSGTLTVTENSNAVTLNQDSAFDWSFSNIDIGRELYLRGETYRIATLTGENTFTLDRIYTGKDDGALNYGVGSVPFGDPWLVRLPTSHLVLKSHRDVVSDIVDTE